VGVLNSTIWPAAGAQARTMRVLTTAVLAAVAMLLAAARAPDDDLSRITGVYRRSFINSMADGTPYRSTDEIVIRRRGRASALVSVHLQFRNGHSCEIGALMRYQADALTAEVDPDPGSGATCAFSIAVTPDVLRLAAKGDGCLSYCGMRGSLDGAQMPRSARRPFQRRHG